MHTHIPQDQLKLLLDQSLQKVTEPAAGLRLRPAQAPPGDDRCTVYIAFRRGFCSSLSLCADTALLARMAKRCLRTDQVTPQDLEEVGKEYLNVLCGQIAVQLFRATRVASRFTVPLFFRGRHEPEGRRRQFSLYYASDQRERAQLIHHIPQFGPAPRGFPLLSGYSPPNEAPLLLEAHERAAPPGGEGALPILETK